MTVCLGKEGSSDLGALVTWRLAQLSIRTAKGPRLLSSISLIENFYPTTPSASNVESLIPC
jgi:hypothetical protein